MTEDEIKAWVKDKTNQDRIVAEYFEHFKPVHSKLAIFMAGIPGAGKTEFVTNSGSRVMRESAIIEHDKLVELLPGYTPETYYKYRKAGSVLVTRLFEECMKRGYSLVVDGTLAHENGYHNIAKCLRKGYSVVVIYIHQDAPSAWQLTQDRELVKKRSIERQGFIDTCKTLNINLRKIFAAFKANGAFAFWIIQKNGRPGFENSGLVVYDHSDQRSDLAAVESILAKEYTVEEL